VVSAEADSSVLSLKTLAESGEYTALAALVHHADMEDALGALAASARDQKALSWVVALLALKLPPEGYEPHAQTKQEAYVQQLNDNLPEDLRVPEELREEVEEFVLTVPTLAQQPWPRGEAQACILRNLDGEDAFALGLAEAVLALEERDEDVEDAAFAVLGRSREPGRRSVIFERTDDLPVEERLPPLTELSTPLYEAEENRLIELLDEALPYSAAVGVDPEARTLAGNLSAEGLEEVLRRRAESSASYQLLSGDYFVAHLWPEKLKRLLSANLPPTLTEQLVAQAASQMPLDPLLEFGRWAYGKIAAELLSPVQNKVSAQIPNPYNPEVHSKCVRALSEFALRTDDPNVAKTLADCASAGDLAALPRSLVSSAARAKRLGRAFASALARHDEDLSEDVIGWIERLADDAYRQALLIGMDEQFQEFGLEVELDLLGPCVLGYTRAARTLCSMDGGRAALEAAEESDDPEGQVLWVVEAAVEELDEAAFETAAKRCTWRSLVDEQYRRLIVAYSRRPEVLLDEAARAIASLDLPEAEAVPPRLLQDLLGAALEHPVEELTQRLDQEPVHYLQQMLDLRGRALHEKALKLAGSLPPDEDLVGLLVSRRDTMQGLTEPFERVLGAYAQKLVATASDASLEAGPRVQALTLASRAEPAAAREAAFELCKANSALIRRAAAEVLATTKSTSEDEPRLQELLEDESDNLVFSNLQAAIRNVSSGDVEEAIRNLWHLVGSTPDGTCTAEVLLPSAWRHETFVQCVDRARARSGGEPTGYIDSLITLSELIVEAALIARYDATRDPSQSLRPNEVELVRANDPAKPDAGDLVNRQQLLQKGFGWFHQVASLRDRRSVHPERTSSAGPRIVTQADVPVAEGLFREVLSGWRNSMLETRRLAQQSSRPTA